MNFVLSFKVKTSVDEFCFFRFEVKIRADGFGFVIQVYSAKWTRFILKTAAQIKDIRS